MKIYYTTRDNGDGSSSVEFMESKEVIELLEEHEPEAYAAGCGGDFIEITGEVIGDDFNPTTMQQAYDSLVARGYIDDIGDDDGMSKYYNEG